jgi:hypothetical protein
MLGSNMSQTLAGFLSGGILGFFEFFIFVSHTNLSCASFFGY